MRGQRDQDDLLEFTEYQETDGVQASTLSTVRRTHHQRTTEPSSEDIQRHEVRNRPGARSTARIRGRRWRGMGSVAAALGAWTMAFTGLAPAAAADDVQSQQWYLDAMQADKLWKVSTGKGVKVAVVDTGVSETLSLEGKLLPGKDLTELSGDVNDDYQGHGTSIAELIVGSGTGGGLRGLAPGAKVIPFRVTLSKKGAEADEYKELGPPLTVMLRSSICHSVVQNPSLLWRMRSITP